MSVSFQFIGWSVGLIFSCVAASVLAGLSLKLSVKCLILPGLFTAVILMIAISLVAILSPAPNELALSSGKVTALIYREAYQYDSDGERIEHPEGWFVRVGKQAPAEVKTTVSNFVAEGTNQAFVSYPGNPGATMRGSVHGLPDLPQQICTGDCDGVAQIPDATIVGTPGIAIADWNRVQSTQIGSQALDSLETIADAPSISTGTWCLSIGLGILFSTNLRHILGWIKERSGHRSAKVPVVSEQTSAKRYRAIPQK